MDIVHLEHLEGELVRLAARIHVAVGAASAANSDRGGIPFADKSAPTTVRALTRVATPENEALLLCTVARGNVAQVERAVRAYRKASGEGETEMARAQYREREVRVVAALEVGTQVRREEERAGGQAVEEFSRESSDAQEESPPTFAQRRADALVLVAESFLDHGPGEGTSASERREVVVHVDASVLSQPESEGRSEIEGGPALSPESARRIACDASRVPLAEDLDGKPLSVGRKTRAVPSALRRALRARDGGCRFRSASPLVLCGSGFSRKGLGEPPIRGQARSYTEGGFRVQALPDGAFRFRRPDGRVLPESPVLPAI